MRYTIGIKEVKEIYHEIEVEVKNVKQIDNIQDKIDMNDFDDIEEVADYIDEIATVCSVDDNYAEISKGFVCEEIFITEVI